MDAGENGSWRTVPWSMGRGEATLEPSSNPWACSPPVAPQRQSGANWEQAALMIVAISCFGMFVIALGSVLLTGLSDRWVDEAVNDHLRQLSRDRPVELPSGDRHQVEAWFAGRVDFVPAIFPGDGDYPLTGGSVGYFLDRKAAVVAYTRHLHPASLLVFPAAGLEWPGGPAATASRGFRVVRWRDGDLAYALVSDWSAPELQALGARIRGEL